MTFEGSFIGTVRRLLLAAVAPLFFGGSSSSSSQQVANQTYTDGRTITNTDSHAVSNSGNTSTVVADAGNNQSTNSTTINYTGTDGGVGHIADLVSQFANATATANAKSVQSLAALGAGAGSDATNLAALSQANSMQLSSQMLNLTGELIDKIATGASTTATAQVAALGNFGQQQTQALANSTSAAASSAAGTMKTALMIGAAVIVAALVFKH